MEFAEFILAHDGDDLAALALARERSAVFPAFDVALSTLEVRRKLRSKVPAWYAVPSLRYPLRLSGEQCSSEETARYKARVALEACRTGSLKQAGPSGVTLRASSVTAGGPEALARNAMGQYRDARGTAPRLADLTGGLGVDSWAFAQCFGSVLYNEMRPELASAAEGNFAALGLGNVTVRNCALVPGDALSEPGMTERSEPGMTVREVLGEFKPDIIFMDPARRASDGRKVFRLEDCQPDVLKLLPELLEACPLLLLKLSPMADISLVCKQLVCVEALHVVAADGECKELLLLLRRGHEGPYSITIYESGAVGEVDQVQGAFPAVDQVQPFFGRGLVSGAGPGPASMDSTGLGGVVGGLGPGGKSGLGPKRGWTRSKTPIPAPASIPPAGDWLFEPGKALLKSGAFEWPCGFGLEKLGRHTHLYIGREIPEELKPFGKTFRILEVLPLDKRSIKDVGARYPQASVTARNIPLTSDELRKKLGVKDGGTVHIFGVHADALQGNLLLICGGA